MQIFVKDRKFGDMSDGMLYGAPFPAEVGDELAAEVIGEMAILPNTSIGDRLDAIHCYIHTLKSDHDWKLATV